jgi:hypothetical protein
MPPKSGLSSGTLGLKFMNRNGPKANTAPASSLPPKVSNAAPGWKPPKEEDEWVVPGWNSGPAAVGKGAVKTGEIEVEDSYLPFLLGDRPRPSSAREPRGSENDEDEDDGDEAEGTMMAGWQATSGKGGRRSFGGLNKTVEVGVLPLSSSSKRSRWSGR